MSQSPIDTVKAQQLRKSGCSDTELCLAFGCSPTDLQKAIGPGHVGVGVHNGGKSEYHATVRETVAHVNGERLDKQGREGEPDWAWAARGFLAKGWTAEEVCRSVGRTLGELRRYLPEWRERLGA